MKCFYHSADLDGHCSGALIKMAYPECVLIKINYGDAFPWELIPIGCGEKVFMVDFSLQPYTEMRKLAIHADPLIWIDHHKSAIEERDIFSDTYLGIQTSGIGACALVWEYIQSKSNLKETPTFVKLLAEYDVWNHTDPRTLLFQYGMRQQGNTYPDNQDFWKSLFDTEKVQRIIEVGSIILSYQTTENKKYANACAFDTELDGLKCIAINKMLTNSQLFDSIWDENKYDAMLVFGFRKGTWTVSLYSTKQNIDVSVIAKNRGGGGHKQAAGFQCSVLPFKMKGNK